ncbi:neurogenic locus notch homolog protein 4-like [Narcine bancroftii]|uniref:neurogenic locus notch homolog protein 4-like n=1 Tax=Narcine bancroftii TaxID=1343680 RepID=UPI0038321635
MYCQSSGNVEPTGPCSAGYWCALAAAVPTPTDGITGDQCLPGSFCTSGSIMGQPCPKGTFSGKVGLTEAAHCQACVPGHYCDEMGITAVSGPCWAGFFCLEGSTFPAPVAATFGDICPTGHYCPKAAVLPIPCPPGTFQPTARSTSVENCTLCPSGFYCLEPGKDSAGDFCEPGFYCKEGAKTAKPRDGITGDICPVGHYCPLGSAAPIPCENGKFMNHTGAEECFTCPESYHCAHRDQAEPCPQGFYCPKGNGISPQPCPSGTFGASWGLEKRSDCTPCLGGSYCRSPGLTQVEGPCDPGFYCESGVDSPRPSKHFNHTGRGGECSAGAYCPSHSMHPNPCPPGTYNSETGQSVCHICLAGHFCLGGLSNLFPLQCPSGHYCPEQTRFAMEYPCPPGTYSSLPGQKSSAGCLPCHPGQFCEGSGLSKPSGNCSKGWFCTGGSTTSKPLCPGEFSNSSECSNPEIVSPGNRCSPGSFCPEGSSLPLICTAGYYCGQYELAEPTGLCDAGYYCPIGSTEQAPDQFKCIAGHYCPEGSAFPRPCPEGTYSRTAMNKALDNCLPCTQGFFCEGTGLLHPTGVCLSGYYCPGGQNSSTPAGFLCPAGSRCPAGSSSPHPCPRGFYQARAGQPDCKPCPTGAYCDSSELENRGVEIPQHCPPGHFCPARTEFATQHKCPRGTFSNKEGQTSADQCETCPPGQFCSQEGLVKPTGSCWKGFYCFGGATSPNPIDGITGDICPVGRYCEAGSSTGVDCPLGYYSNKTGLTSPSDCTVCDPGLYCNQPGNSSPQGPCAAGHYCKLGAQTPNPTNGVEGFLCPAGYYCTSGTTSPAPCPVGTYNPLKGKGSLTDCLPCDPGHYCSNVGQAQPSGGCYAGFYCNAASTQPDRHVCPAGFYCPNSTVTPHPCPSGTYSNDTGNKKESNCQPCLSGQFCDGSGNEAPDGPCLAGFYCPPGQSSASPISYVCPVGYFCPKGTSIPVKCKGGTYQAQEGQDLCEPCPAGFFCPFANDSGERFPELCPKGFFCPIGTTLGTEHPCAEGTYGPWPGAVSALGCVPCLAGMHCASNGLSSPTGPCHAGYYCTASAINPTPIKHLVDSDNGSFSGNDVCPMGHYCPEGSKYPLPCPLGSYSPTAGLRSEEQCQRCPIGHFCDQLGLTDLSKAQLCDPGYICYAGSTVPCPSDGIQGYMCPSGVCCPPGTISEIPCNPGTYNPLPGAGNCLPCPAGTICINSSTVEPVICPRGYYSFSQSSLPLPCPEGTYNALEGASFSDACVSCSAGFFCQGVANSEPDGPCMGGYYCQGGAKGPVPQSNPAFPINGPCAVGYYCPTGTKSPVLCPVGTFKNKTGE